jgi:hypothetical protein
MPTHALPGNGARHHNTIQAPDTATTFSAVSVRRPHTRCVTRRLLRSETAGDVMTTRRYPDPQHTS